MIYNLPRKAKKYTWYKYDAVDNRNIVCDSTKSLVQREYHESDFATVRYYRGITKSEGTINGTTFVGESNLTTRNKTFKVSDYFYYYGWYCDREFITDNSGWTSVYAYEYRLDNNWAKGSTSYGTVTSEEENTYPENGYYNGYWYVKKK